jgi:hypothetical protein
LKYLLKRGGVRQYYLYCVTKFFIEQNTQVCWSLSSTFKIKLICFKYAFY